MVIGFYPGAGGHRYYNWINNRPMSTVGKVYDNAPTDVENRYTTKDSKSLTRKTTTSHCVHYDTLKNAYINHDTFVIVCADLKKCLYREYRLIGKQRYLKNQIIANQDLEIIEHYHTYKDATWPQIYSIEQYQKLPAWILHEVESDRKKVKPNIDFLAAEATIKFHYGYYKNYPLQIGDATVVDIDQDDNKFCEVMRTELNVSFTDEFDQAWEKVVG